MGGLTHPCQGFVSACVFCSYGAFETNLGVSRNLQNILRKFSVGF